MRTRGNPCKRCLIAKKEPGLRLYCAPCSPLAKAEAERRVYERRGDRIRARASAWYVANKDRVRERYTSEEGRRRAREYVSAKRKTDVSYRVSSNISRSVRFFLGGEKAGRWSALLNYDGLTLVAHLERQFSRGMTWENYGTRWEIDHIIPRAAFPRTREGAIACWTLSNLRPLWSEANRAKSATRELLI